MAVKLPCIGISMRMMHVVHSHEWRDALATDWAPYLATVCAGRATWVMLPNIEGEVVAYVQSLGVTGLILSGGDDIGATPRRDATEMCLLDYAAQHSLPVVGVCRGMQMLQHHCGGGMCEVSATLHVAQRHNIIWQAASAAHAGDIREVNSFHQHGIAHQKLARDLVPLAVCQTDGTVEALRHVQLPWLGLLWHPEREAQPASGDIALLQQFLHIT